MRDGIGCVRLLMGLDPNSHPELVIDGGGQYRTLYSCW